MQTEGNITLSNNKTHEDPVYVRIPVNICQIS